MFFILYLILLCCSVDMQAASSPDKPSAMQLSSFTRKNQNHESSAWFVSVILNDSDIDSNSSEIQLDPNRVIKYSPPSDSNSSGNQNSLISSDEDKSSLPASNSGESKLNEDVVSYDILHDKFFDAPISEAHMMPLSIDTRTTNSLRSYTNTPLSTSMFLPKGIMSSTYFSPEEKRIQSTSVTTSTLTSSALTSSHTSEKSSSFTKGAFLKNNKIMATDNNDDVSFSNTQLYNVGQYISDNVESEHNELMDAARQNNLAVLQKFIQEHKNLDGTDAFNMTALHKAILYEHYDFAQQLIEGHAHVNLMSKLYNFKMIKKRNEMFTPLHVATIKNHYPLVLQLIVAGAMINERSYKGFTPLHLSILHHYHDHEKHEDDLQVFKLYVDRNANVHAVTNDGKTALHLVVDEFCRNIKKNPNNFMTRLHRVGNYADIVRSLIDAHIDIEAQTTTGKTALDLLLDSRSSGNQFLIEMINLLIESGAVVHTDRKPHSSCVDRCNIL